MPEIQSHTLDTIAQRIFELRGQRVMLDEDLATLYGVETKNLNKAVKRNPDRFPEDFMFQLSVDEWSNLKFQTGTSNLRSQIGTSSWGGRRYTPYAFTEQGVAMLSSVLNSEQSVQVNVAIMRAFVQLRGMLASHAELSRKLSALEQKYDERFKIVFEAIRELMEPSKKEQRKIGF